MGTLQAERRHSCAVLVIGSGVSGYCAAIQAGRLGCRTILIEKDEVLGGNSGPNCGVGITGADRYNCYAAETGVVHEIQEEAAWIQAFTQVSCGTMPYNISRRYEALVQETLEKAGVTILKRHYAREPILDEDGRIQGILAEDLAAFHTVRIDVEHVVIDASGDGEIGVLAGADHDVGTEAQREFGERSAPAERSRTVQGTSLVAIAQNAGREVVFVPPADTPRYYPRLWHGRLGSSIRHHDRWFAGIDGLKFLYVTEAGGQMDTVRNDGQIYETLLGQLWAEWDHIKNGPHCEDARNWDLVWVSPKAGKRESRRLLGDVILTQTDLEAGRLFPDDIAYGGHDLDDHQPVGLSVNIFGHSIPPLYGIPYRACYSRNVPNLLLAGRLISATHLAHSSTRIMRTGGAIGQAVGTAAALCCKYGCRPRDVYEQHLDELRRSLLEEDATILARPVDGHQDIAREATVSATSELRFNDQEPGQWVPLTAPGGVVLWNWPFGLDRAEFYLCNDSDQEQALTLTVYRSRREPKWKGVDDYDRYGRHDLRDSEFSTVTSLPVVLPSRHVGWYAVDFPGSLQLGEKDPVSDDDRVLIALSANPLVSWALAGCGVEIAEMVDHSHHSEGWSGLGVMATLRLTPGPGLGEATQVTNGYHRRFSRGPTNLWMSDPRQGMPQELELAWPQEQTFDEVCLVFDNLAQHRHDNPWECATRVLPFLIKDYELLYRRGDEWHSLVQEEGNYHRFRRHRFPAVTAAGLRLRVLSTHGGGEGARVYQVRVRESAQKDRAQ